MKCPICDSRHTTVIDSRESNLGVRRRRVCQECLTRFTTYEFIQFNSVDKNLLGRKVSP